MWYDLQYISSTCQSEIHAYFFYDARSDMFGIFAMNYDMICGVYLVLTIVN